MTTFANSLYGQCSRRHVVGQQVVSDITVLRSVVEVSVTCVHNNTNMLTYYACDVHCCTWNVYFATHIKRTLTYNMAACNR